MEELKNIYLLTSLFFWCFDINLIKIEKTPFSLMFLSLNLNKFWNLQLYFLVDVQEGFDLFHWSPVLIDMARELFQLYRFLICYSLNIALFLAQGHEYGTLSKNQTHKPNDLANYFMVVTLAF